MDFIFYGPEDADATILLAHGAGSAMDSPAMEAIAAAIAGRGLRAARFEFGYMAARRTGSRKPPPKAELLISEYTTAVEALGARPLIIGGKSMGGRVASMVADELHGQGKISGLLCLGYPFHPPTRPDKLRTAHLEAIRTPTLICQGTRDPFGTRDEVNGYDLAETIEFLWLEDGDHDLKPRKTISGLSSADHLRTVSAAVADFAGRVAKA